MKGSLEVANNKKLVQMSRTFKALGEVGGQVNLQALPSLDTGTALFPNLLKLGNFLIVSGPNPANPQLAPSSGAGDTMWNATKSGSFDAVQNITGDVRILANDLTELDGLLPGVSEIGGSFVVSNTNSLKFINGVLPSLTSCGPVEISQTVSLENVTSSLVNLARSGTLTIAQNLALRSLALMTSAENVGSVESDCSAGSWRNMPNSKGACDTWCCTGVVLSNNPKLVEVAQFARLSDISGGLVVNKCPVLEDLDSFSRLQNVSQTLRFTDSKKVKLDGPVPFESLASL